jgi:NAD(P)-dependent dehydrogenase (short-subunit alcohol dehydrogenase family)
MSDDFAARLFQFTKVWHTRPYPFISPTRPELSCEGKNVVVTGGATGIGHGVAVAFAQAGARSLTIIGRRESKLKQGVASISAESQNSVTQVDYQVADLFNSKQAKSAIDAVASKVGKIDILVSNAAGPVQPGPLLGFDPASVAEAVRDNLTCAFSTAQAFLLASGESPVIINTSSSCAHWKPMAGTSLYSMQKATVLKMFDFLAKENPKVHVVNVQPGWVASDMNGHQEIAPDSGELAQLRLIALCDMMLAVSAAAKVY